MNAKDEGQQKREWVLGPAGINRETGVGSVVLLIDGEMQIRPMFTVGSGSLQEALDTLNALQQQVTELEGKAARYEEALRDVLDEAEMCELTDSGYCLRHASRPPCSTGSVLTAARDALTSPSTIAHEHNWTLVMDDGEGMPYRQCRLPGCGLAERPPYPSTIAQKPPEGLTPEEEIAWAESLPNAADGAYTQEMTEAYSRAQAESSTIAQEEQR